MALRMKNHIGVSLAELRYEPTPARIRAFVDGEPVLDTCDALLVWEPRRLLPVYAVPVHDVTLTMQVAQAQPEDWDLIGVPMMLGPEDFWLHTARGTSMDLAVGSRHFEGAGFVPDDADLGERVVLDFGAFDAWWAEDEELFGHPRDPFKRIDVLASSRQVEVSVDGVELASSSWALMLFETHLPVRYYVPPSDVRMDLLAPSETRSTCAYKGVATYLSTRDGAESGQDIAWTYPDPLDDALRVRDHVCFWAERTDLVVDGEPIERPVTPWSRPEEQASADPDRLEFG